MKKGRPYRNIPVLLLAFLVTTVLSSSSRINDGQQTQNSNLKKVNMLDILESLEKGEEYSKIESWGEKKYIGEELADLNLPDFDHFEFDLDFPEFDFSQFDLKDFERRMEDLGTQIEEKMEEMVKRFELIQRKYEKNL